MNLGSCKSSMLCYTLSPLSSLAPVFYIDFYYAIISVNRMLHVFYTECLIHIEYGLNI